MTEANDNSHGTYSANSQIKFKNLMLRWSLCDKRNVYIRVRGTITFTEGEEADDAAKQADKRDTGVIFKNCALFTKCISKINNVQVDDAQDTSLVMSMYNLSKYNDNCLKSSGRLWHY